MIRRPKKILVVFCLMLLCNILLMNVTYGENNPVIAKNIEFVNADLRDVLRTLADLGKFNIIIDKSVNGDVTLTLKYGVTLKDAITVISKTYGYGCRWIADQTVVVGTPKYLSENFDRKISKVFQLKYADPLTVAGSLEVVIPKKRIKADANTNQITVMASEEELQNISEIISRLDRELPMINIETKMEEVTTNFWKEIGVDNTFPQPHMGIYLLTEQQLKAVENNQNINILTKPNLTALDNHEGKIFIGDKISLITEKTKQGEINYKVEYVDAGTNIWITPRINSDNKITIKAKVAVSTIANKSKPGSEWIPWVVTREFESTVRLEAGQAFILSGLLQRNEYKMMKQSPYGFPMLNQLFANEGSIAKTSNNQAEVIILITPKFMGKIESPIEEKTETPVSSLHPEPSTQPTAQPDENSVLPDDANNQNQVSTPAVSNPETENYYSKPLLEEVKPEVNIEVNNKGNNGEVENSPIISGKFKDIVYQVKKGDSLLGIVRKFGTELQLVVEKNKLETTGIIKTNAKLIIPVPSERFYTIKPKETLWRISKRYGTTLAILKELNGITDETKINAGQEIVLPVSVDKIINPEF